MRDIEERVESSTTQVPLFALFGDNAFEIGTLEAKQCEEWHLARRSRDSLDSWSENRTGLFHV